jgi:hypothetical protein
MSVSVNGTTGLTFSDGSSQATAWVPGMRNRIINGGMVVDQRGSASSPVTATSSDKYSVDRFASYIGSGSGVFTAQQSSVAPAGFINSMKTTVTTTDSSLASTDNYQLFIQYIEGLNVSDLGWGASGAATITISFWARSSVTGTYPVSVRNSGASRSYVTTFTINAVDTWEYKTMTILGDTSGTWLTTNGVGVNLNVASVAGSDKQAPSLNTWFSGNYTSHSSCTNWMATNAATFYITGVQLEKGSTATSFDYRPYGTELALCQRYYEKSYDSLITPGTGSNFSGSMGFGSRQVRPQGFFSVVKRNNPSMTAYAPNTGESGKCYKAGSAVLISFAEAGTSGFTLQGFNDSADSDVRCHWTATSEL